MRNVRPFYHLLGCLAGAQLLCAVNISAQDGYVRTSSKRHTNAYNRTYVPGATGDTNGKETLIAVLKNLNRQKGVYFLFSDESLGNKIVNPVKDPQAEIEKILDEVLDNTGLKYKKISE